MVEALGGEHPVERVLVVPLKQPSAPSYLTIGLDRVGGGQAG